MANVFSDIEAGDLLIATRTIYAVDTSIDSMATLWEGNTTAYPKGTIVLVVEPIKLKNNDMTPVINVLIGETLVSLLFMNLEIIQKGGALSS